MRFCKYLFIIVLSSFTLHSCINDEERDSIDENGPVAVKFTSTLDGVVQSKAAGASWDANDKIGVFMKKNNHNLSTENIIGSADNVEYITTDGSGNFSASNGGATIFYPTDGSLVDFITYYPYKGALSNFIYDVDVTNQSKQEDIDLLYSSNSKGLSQSDPTSVLSFSHQLSKIKFNVIKGEGVTSLAGLQISVVGMPTLADFNLVDGTLTINNGSIATFNAKVSADGTQGEAILLPIGTVSSQSIKFTLAGKTHTWIIPAATQFNKGITNSYNITLKNTGGAVVEPIFGWIETPKLIPVAGADMTYVVHKMPNDASKRNYSLYYDKTNKVALWVAYPLNSSYLGSGRHETWQNDPEIASSAQFQLSSSWGVSDYNRGHQIANSDRNATTAGSQSTFYYSNMTYQNTQFNGDMWNKLETKVQSWSRLCDTLYVTTGIILTSKTPGEENIVYANTSKFKNIPNPRYFYKALAKREGSTYYTIAYKMRNVANNGGNYDSYRISVSDLERETGFTFFPSIPQSAKEEIVTSKWN